MASKDIRAGGAFVEVSLRDRVGKGLAAIERKLSASGRSIATLGAAITGGGLATIAWPLKLAADMEQTTVAFEVMTGSAENAKKLLESLKTFAASTPFGMTELSENARLLMSYGIAADDIVGTLRILGDVSGGSAEKLSRLALAYGQVQANGKLMGGEVRQMIETGFNPLKEISRTTGQSMLTLTKRMEDGKISAADLTKAFITATSKGGNFFNLMDAQSKTSLGLWSSIVDNVVQSLTDFGTTILEALKPGLQLLVTFTGGLRSFIAANAGTLKILGLVAVGVVAVGAALTAVGLAAMAAATVVGGLFTAWGFLVAIVPVLLSPLGAVVAALIAAAAAAFYFRDAIGRGLAAIGSALKTIATVALTAVTAFGGLFAAVGIAVAIIPALFSPLGAAIIALAAAAGAAYYFRDAIANALNNVAGYLQPIADAIGRVWSIFQETFGGIVAALAGGELQTAAQIAWLGFAAAAWQGIAELGDAVTTALDFLSAWIPGVDAIRSYLGETFASIGQSILAGRWDLAGAILMTKLRLAIDSGWSSISFMWSAFTIGLMTIFETMGSAIRKTFREAVFAIAGYITWIGEKLGLVTEGATAEVAKMKAEAQKTDDKAVAGRDANRYAAAQSAMDAAKQRSLELQNKLAALEQQSAQASDAAGNPTLSDKANNAGLALQDAIRNAEAEREKAAAGAPGTKGSPIPKLAAKAADTVAKVESKGSFSAAAAALFGLGSGDDAADRTATNTQLIATRMQHLNDKLGAGATV